MFVLNHRPGIDIQDQDGLWIHVSDTILRHLPLENVILNNNYTNISTLNVELFTSYCLSHLAPDITEIFNHPYVCMLIIGCESSEHYKTSAKLVICKFIEMMKGQSQEWMIIYIPMGTEKPKKYRNVFHKMKADIVSNQRDRCFMIDGPTPTLDGFVDRLKLSIVDCFIYRMSLLSQIQLDDPVDFFRLFCIEEAKIILALQMQQASIALTSIDLIGDHLLHYDHNDSQNMDHVKAIFAKPSNEFRSRLVQGFVSRIELSHFIFYVSSQLLFILDRSTEFMIRGLAFVHDFSQLLEDHFGAAVSAAWSAQSYLSIANAASSHSNFDNRSDFTLLGKLYLMALSHLKGLAQMLGFPLFGNTCIQRKKGEIIEQIFSRIDSPLLHSHMQSVDTFQQHFIHISDLAVSAFESGHSSGFATYISQQLACLYMFRNQYTDALLLWQKNAKLSWTSISFYSSLQAADCCVALKDNIGLLNVLKNVFMSHLDDIDNSEISTLTTRLFDLSTSLEVSETITLPLSCIALLLKLEAKPCYVGEIVSLCLHIKAKFIAFKCDSLIIELRSRLNASDVQSCEIYDQSISLEQTVISIDSKDVQSKSSALFLSRIVLSVGGLEFVFGDSHSYYCKPLVIIHKQPSVLFSPAFSRELFAGSCYLPFNHSNSSIIAPLVLESHHDEIASGAILSVSNSFFSKPIFGWLFTDNDCPLLEESLVDLFGPDSEPLLSNINSPRTMSSSKIVSFNALAPSKVIEKVELNIVDSCSCKLILPAIPKRTRLLFFCPLSISDADLPKKISIDVDFDYSHSFLFSKELLHFGDSLSFTVSSPVFVKYSFQHSYLQVMLRTQLPTDCVALIKSVDISDASLLKSSPFPFLLSSSAISSLVFDLKKYDVSKSLSLQCSIAHNYYGKEVVVDRFTSDFVLSLPIKVDIVKLTLWRLYVHSEHSSSLFTVNVRRKDERPNDGPLDLLVELVGILSCSGKRSFRVSLENGVTFETSVPTLPNDSPHIILNQVVLENNVLVSKPIEPSLIYYTRCLQECN